MSTVTSSSRHLTASAVVFHPDLSGHVLLIWHKASQLWLVPDEVPAVVQMAWPHVS